MKISVLISLVALGCCFIVVAPWYVTLGIAVCGAAILANKVGPE